MVEINEAQLIEFGYSSANTFIDDVFCWAELTFPTVLYTKPGKTHIKYGGFRHLLAVSKSNESIKISKPFFQNINPVIFNKWIFGFLSYDLKNEIESLSSKNNTEIAFPEYYLFEPELLLEIVDKNICIICGEKLINEFLYARKVINKPELECTVHISPSIRFIDYQKVIHKIQKHIKEGDLYEINYCIPHTGYFTNDSISKYFLKKNTSSKTPFSSFFKFDSKYILSFSPERFIKKKNYSIISQPIKGTKGNVNDKAERRKRKSDLINDLKEKAEHIMIVDLVRNDLAKFSIPGTVKVSELCKIYSFPTVLQMISTVESQISGNLDTGKILASTFPMGSMTGAPKIKAMEIAEQLEVFKRGPYSGALGYFSPDGNFDFSVLIRTLLLEKQTKKAFYATGGAITIDSDPKKEWEECMTKAKIIND